MEILLSAMITMIFPANVAKVWPHAASLLEEALFREKTHDIEDIRKLLMTGNAQLWLQWDGRAEAAVVTEFRNYPKGLWLNVWLIGVMEDVELLEEDIERTLFEFAHANGATALRVTGRKGWQRRFYHRDHLHAESVVYDYFISDIIDKIGGLA